jgi:hypothetical protein
MGEAEENDLIWKTDSSSVEIRFQGRLEDGRPAFDEVVATGAGVHLEQMGHDQWWMGIEAGGRYFHLNFSLDDGRLHVHLSDQTDDQGDEDAEWEGDNREKHLPGVSWTRWRLRTNSFMVTRRRVNPSCCGAFHMPIVSTKSGELRARDGIEMW